MACFVGRGEIGSPVVVVGKKKFREELGGEREERAVTLGGGHIRMRVDASRRFEMRKESEITHPQACVGGPWALWALRYQVRSTNRDAAVSPAGGWASHLFLNYYWLVQAL
jgi:hypothetical protein